MFFHHDADDLRQRGDSTILETDDGEQLKNHEKQECGEAEQGDGLILNAEEMSEPAECVAARGEDEKRQAEKDEDEGVTFFELIDAESADGHEEES